MKKLIYEEVVKKFDKSFFKTREKGAGTKIESYNIIEALVDSVNENIESEIELENIKILNIKPKDSLIVKVDPVNFRREGSVDEYIKIIKKRLKINNTVLLISKDDDFEILSS